MLQRAAARLSSLETALFTSKHDNAEAKLLPAALQTEGENLLPIYRLVVRAVDAAMAGRAWEFDENGCMAKGHASIKDHPNSESDRKLRWERD
jgi:hypothetical protein